MDKDALPPLREVMQAHGISPKKSLGQNFLLDLNLTQKIAGLSGDLSNATVLEVGPGPGGLTRGLLLQGAKHVIAIERDRRCIAALQSLKARYGERLTIIEGDALKIDYRDLKPTHIISNLPYNIGTELLINWLSTPDWPPDWKHLCLMFQKEVAERITAAQGSKSYGRLSVLARWRSDAKIVLNLPARAFTPPPKIDSAVVKLTLREKPLASANLKTLERVTKAAFGQRRKMLRSSLKALTPESEALLIALGISPMLRAEEISVERFCAISNEIDRISGAR